MSTLDLEEQEQLATLKAWWQRYGNLMLSLATAVLIVLAAWNGWRWYQNSQSAQAAALYEELQRAARAIDTKAVRDAAGAILEKYPRTAYGPMAALVAARVNVQAGDLKSARAQLQWAVDNARSDALRAVARLRLATVLADDGAAEEALKVIEVKPEPGFEALFASQRGDILVQLKRIPDAKKAYSEAIEKVEKRDRGFSRQLRIKLDALGAA